VITAKADAESTLTSFLRCATRKTNAADLSVHVTRSSADINPDAISMDDARIYVLPLNDLKPHVENGEWCHCQPRIDGDVVIHNAYDGREFYKEEFEPA
jgi:hypothetical protein